LLPALESLLEVGSAVALQQTVNGAHSDSRRVEPGSIFIALPGERSQGVDYLDQAFANGAQAALVGAEASIPPRWRDRCLLSGAIRRDGALLAAAAFGQPSEQLLCFGVTGSNGKTSSCYLLAAMLRAAGHQVVTLTTVAHEFADWQQGTPNTTPDAPVLQAVLARARDAGATAAVVEVSAHGIVLERITGCRFDAVLFTNLTRDHQDFFAGMEPYFAAKRCLFTESRFTKPGAVAAISTDDEYGQRLLEACPLPRVSFGAGRGSDASHVSTDDIRLSSAGMSGQLRFEKAVFPIKTDLAGRFNVRNLAGAFALASFAGLAHSALADTLQSCIRVPGRLMSVASGAPFRVIVDFAHTDAALANLLQGLREDTQGRLLVMFGAGGDKDPARRQSLPETAFYMADMAVMTLDNPRSEDPAAILASMQAHWEFLRTRQPERAPPMHMESDRRVAIECLLAKAHPGDTVVLAGKGHETTQIFADRVELHDDHAIAQAWLQQHYPERSGRAVAAGEMQGNGGNTLA
jgi:UDP-N-acetylmuramoyl-L-alanyl-D-glutamate--2,6-diaminopimelate ligase